MKHILNYLSKNISIRNKIFISYIIILIPVFILALTTGSIISSKDIKSSILFSADSSLKQTESFIEYKVKSTKSIMTTISINDILLEILDKDVSVYSSNPGYWSYDSQELNKILYYASEIPDIDNVIIYFNSSLGALYETNTYLNLRNFTDAQWYQIISASTNKVNWFISNDLDIISDTPMIVAMKKIPRSNNLNQVNGILRLDFPRIVFDSLLDQANITSNTIAIIASPTQIISNSSNLYIDDCTNDSNAMSISSNPKNAPLANELFEYSITNNDDSNWNANQLNGETYYIGTQKIEGCDWTLVIAVPEKDITDSVKDSTIKLAVILLPIIPLTIPLALLIAFSITHRIKQLMDQIKEISNSNLNIKLNDSGQDEIGILSTKFNHMISRISKLLDEKYELGKELKTQEMIAQQAQINPHFLYNTLDQIYWMSIKHKEEDISNLVLALSKFYKLSLGHGESMVSLAAELEHIQLYVKIQNLRFNNAIILEINISSKSLSYKIPKLTLQPIIENAILHGILESISENGIIKVYESFTEDAFLLIIEDNGKGIDAKTLDLLSNSLKNDANKKDCLDSKCYGLKNIHTRLQLHYGLEYGLHFESIEGQWTKVILHLPLK